MASAHAQPLQLERIEELAHVEADWRRLAALTGHPFATWDWANEWWKAYGAGRELATFVVRGSDGQIAVILPLYIASAKPVRIARFLGYGDVQSPLCAPGDRPMAARALREITRRRVGACRLVWAEHLPAEAGWAELVEGRELATHPDPVLHFASADWDAYLASRSKNFRDQVRRRERKIVRETGLTFRLATDPQRLHSDMEALFALHGERWGSETTGVFEGQGAAFHQAVAAGALRDGWLRLWLAEIDGRIVAAWYGWRFAEYEWYFQAGRDGAYEQLSLGFVLLAHTIREACTDGMRGYHFLAGDEAYKSRFTEEDPGAVDLLVGSPALTRATSAALGRAHALPPRLRRVVMRASG